MTAVTPDCESCGPRRPAVLLADFADHDFTAALCGDCGDDAKRRGAGIAPLSDLIECAVCQDTGVAVVAQDPYTGEWINRPCTCTAGGDA